MAVRIGVMGGSGLYDMAELEGVREVRVSTPFGEPSDAVRVGRLEGGEVAFLPRHGRGHRLLPSEVPYRANIWAMRMLGVEWLLSVSAVGSLRKKVVPGQVVCCDQFIDRTRGRVSTFFGDGVVAHVGFGDPVCRVLHGALVEAARAAGAVVHKRGTYVCMEGPAFSTRAESELYRSWGADVVGMTNVPECKLAREAEMSYATLALATDYDCWHPGHEAVTVEQVVATVQANTRLAQQVIRALVPRIPEGRSPYAGSLRGAIMTAPEVIPAAARERLGLLVGPYL